MSDWLSPTVPRRFWAKVDRRGVDDCWPWTGSLQGNGYGSMAVGTLADHQTEAAHRVAYVLQVGPIPTGVTVDHLCFNRACQNAAHMELVSRAENGRRGADHRGPGHRVRGSQQGMSKLTEADVLQMRRDYTAKVANLPMLAEQYGVSQAGAWAAITGKGWAHVAEAVTDDARPRRTTRLVLAAGGLCGRGHAKTEENTYRWRDVVACRACRIEAGRRRRAA